MEWKEYVAWFAPISITMVAYVFIKYESDLPRHRPVRDAVFAFAAGRVLSAALAAALGAMINKKAPVQGGGTIELMRASK
jgi:hypothetical protein